MHARRRTPAMLLLLSLCAMAGLLLSPASAEALADSPAAGGEEWVVADQTADAPRAVTTAATAPRGSTDLYVAAAADADAVAMPATAQRFKPHYASALSPDAKRALEHEAHCGPRVPVRRGFPWPDWGPNCRPKPPAALLRRPWWDEP